MVRILLKSSDYAWPDVNLWCKVVVRQEEIINQNHYPNKQNTKNATKLRVQKWSKSRTSKG